ncbi:MAG: sulfatase, partial [Sphingobacteriaceae bacterium]|nr:sulfatase [Sphingobacteriaceae bacterium]
YGDVIKPEFKGKTIDKVGSQQDLAATLLAQMGLVHKDFIWSKNLLNPYSKNFAYFSWNEGFGFINKQHCMSFDNIGRSILYNNDPKNKIKSHNNLILGKSYLQTAYEQFIKL